MLKWLSLLLFTSVVPFCLFTVVIGFVDTSYTVSEGIGTLQVDVRVRNIPDDQPLPVSNSVDLVIQSVSGSASK